MTNGDNYCYHLFKGIYVNPVEKDKVQLGHCCLADAKQSDYIPLTEVSLHHESLVKNREHYLKTGELPPHCNHCINAEAAGIETRRIVSGKPDHNITDVELLSLEFNTYNVCNLLCVMCGPQNSSSWKRDYDLLNGNDFHAPKTKNSASQVNLDVSKLQSIYFNGGEPLMNQDIETWLSRCEEKNVTPKIVFNTNGTHKISNKLAEHLRKLPDVIVLISVDGLHQQFEYIRWPGKWSQIQEFIQHLRELNLDNLRFGLNPNLGIQNLFYFVDLISFAEENEIACVFNPTRGDKLDLMYLHPDVLTAELMEGIHAIKNDDLREKVLATVSTVGSNVNWEWVRFLDRLDDMRDLNWRESLSQLWEAVKHHPEAHYDPNNIYYSAPLGIKSHIIAKG